MFLSFLALSAPFPAYAKEPITPIDAPLFDAKQTDLGRLLFHDPRLSRDGSRSCSSCHDTRLNGASRNRFDQALDGQPLELNTPTVFNAALNYRLNWEGGATTLQEQARASLLNPKIMGADMKTLIETLDSDDTVRRLADVAYGRPLDEDVLLDAIAAYETSLVLPNSRFDRWLAGDETALTAVEKEGYVRFKEIGCAACHQGRNVGGNLFQRHGIFHPLASPKPERLRVPSLRTVADTPPYFHDGSAETLGKAIQAMGRSQLDVDLDRDDVERIEAFLLSLKGNLPGETIGARAP
ncbi:cytochrome c peroxidase [Rhizobium sp. CG5]|uniref:cytochrome-c peroxidase n=1 Tax=Rhizobium sp. CG5 TaxID=2726076 RepID=UPI0020340477